MTEETTKKTTHVQSVGRRKSASARSRITKGKGEITVNSKPFVEYFPYFELQEIVLSPLVAVGAEKKYNFSLKIVGGGPKGQAGAAKHAIARNLIKLDEDYRKVLRAGGFLTRDSRVKERKKPGKRGARRGQQWKKR